MEYKVKLIKKSGPGELIGITEITTKDSKVDFTGLQFSDPGDYILSVQTDDITLKSIDIRLKALPEEEFIEQEPKPSEEIKIAGERPIIAQIVKPNISLPPIEFKITNNDQVNKEIGVGLGLTPFLWYNSYQIETKDIYSLNLYHDRLLPKTIITFIDSQGMMKKDGMPLDDSKFELFLNSGSKDIKSIHLKFKIENFKENRNGSYTMTGTIDISSLYNIKWDTYRGTSYDVLLNLTKEYNLGFNSNILNTNDLMVWANEGYQPTTLIQNIIKHSYISDKSFMAGYIDYYYSFNYVDIEKEWLRDISNDVGLDNNGSQFLLSESDKEKISRLNLSNDASYRNSNCFISSYSIKNNSTSQSLNKGHFMSSKVYDSNTKQFLVFDVDSLTSDGDKSHILKGAPSDSKDIKENQNSKYHGRIDTENVHVNYYYAETQNVINYNNLARISVDMELHNPNYNLYRYQKVNIIFVNQHPSVNNADINDKRISGEWLIINIGYTWSLGKLVQKIQAVRKELGKTEDEIINTTPVVGNIENNTENNINPDDDIILSDDVPINTEYDTFIYSDNSDGVVDEKYVEGNFEGEEEDLSKLAVDISERSNEQSAIKDTTPIAGANVSNSDIDDNSYIGDAWKAFDINAVVGRINKTQYKAKIFSNSLKMILGYIKRDASITDVRWGAYLLGTAFTESGYSLQRWEADYACNLFGKPYGTSGPCNSALSYFRSTKGKKNYYNSDVGVDSNGFPYFGRGLIQLTGRDNYKTFGKIIGVDLINHPDRALEAINSYKIASAFMIKRGVFRFVSNNDLTLARKRVNGGSNGLNEVNGAYKAWLNILNSNNIA